ncbi:unnamed protein product [Cyclocybe aegerita]|uniref:Uncharacterized protein n=1 Tax=Cyclocybe aegerita TaxID=1973307 RepID=A0A8S0WD96_CYCAE|nr:unnamed protein product [Cyclocybe aegerita]
MRPSPCDRDVGWRKPPPTPVPYLSPTCESTFHLPPVPLIHCLALHSLTYTCLPAHYPPPDPNFLLGCNSCNPQLPMPALFSGPSSSEPQHFDDEDEDEDEEDEDEDEEDEDEDEEDEDEDEEDEDEDEEDEDEDEEDEDEDEEDEDEDEEDGTTMTTTMTMTMT